MNKTLCNKYLQYKHMRRYMELLDTFLEPGHYGELRRIRQDNDYCIKPFQKTYPFEQYKLIRQLNEFKIKNRL